MEAHRSVSILIRTILGCCGLFSAPFAVSQEHFQFEPEAVVEAHRLTLGRQFVLFNQVLFGGEDSPPLSIRFAYDPSDVQSWILSAGNNEPSPESMAAIVEERSDVVLLPPSDDSPRRSPFGVSVYRPSTLVRPGEYKIGSDGYVISVSDDGSWSVKDSSGVAVSLGDGVPEMVYDLQRAIDNSARIGLDTRIEGLRYESFVIEGPLPPSPLEASSPAGP